MIQFDNSYRQLPPEFYHLIDFTNSYDPTLISFNHKLAAELGLDCHALDTKTLAQYFSAAAHISGSSPLAMAYAGHQFGHFSPQLGDGRAMLLGEFISPDKKRYDIHLKGSGRTYYSRGGDGKSALGPVIREYLLSEGMHALGVPTTRTLCAVRTGETVQREGLTPGAVSTRLALSHIRVGTFEYFAARNDLSNLRKLTDYSISRLYPELIDHPEPIIHFWRAVCQRQMKLISKWMSLGFIHGVMNTDNMTISGETIDYGPCAFIDNFSFNQVFSSIDHNGRYAYSNQPMIAIWNLARLAECLMPLIEKSPEELISLFTAELDKANQFFQQEHLRTMISKFGLRRCVDGDQDLIQQWLALLERNSLDFTLSYIDLERVLANKKSFTQIEATAGFELFLKNLNNRLTQDGRDLNACLNDMAKTNPMTIPRNHQVQRVIDLCETGDDSAFFSMLEATAHPFDRSEELGVFQQPPTPEQRVEKTFCGT